CHEQSSGVCRLLPVRSGGKRSVTACSSITTRMPRTVQRAPLTPCVRFLTRESLHRSIGMKWRVWIQRDSPYLRVPGRFAKIGNPHAEMDSFAGSLEKLLDLADKDEAAGLGDAPWPPHFRKMQGEAPRVMPSRAKSAVRKPRVKMPLIVIANSPDK